MSSPEPSKHAAWGCLAVPAALAFLLWALWPSAADNARWDAMRANAIAAEQQ